MFPVGYLEDLVKLLVDRITRTVLLLVVLFGVVLVYRLVGITVADMSVLTSMVSSLNKNVC